MSIELLTNIAETINGNSSTYHATVPMVRRDYWMQVGSRLMKKDCLTLLITMTGRPQKKSSKTQWTVYEYDIERTTDKLARKDISFASRLSGNNLSLRDVEIIIRRSTYQLLKLRLIPVGLDCIHILPKEKDSIPM